MPEVHQENSDKQARKCQQGSGQNSPDRIIGCRRHAGAAIKPADTAATRNGHCMAVTKQNSANVSHRPEDKHRKNEKKDARVLRTRKRIDAAFVELLHRRPYGDIRVADVAKKAGVGRATFYAHYSTKDELLRSQFERIVAPMLIASPGEPSVLDASPFFAHIGSAPHLYRALMGANSGNAPRILRGCFEARVRKALGLDSCPRGLTQAALSRFVASSVLAITECWLEQGGSETPHQLQALFANLVAPGLSACRKAGYTLMVHRR